MLPVEGIVMARHVKCMRGEHDWQKFETPEGDAGQQCARCEKVVWSDGKAESHGPRDRDWKALVEGGGQG